MRSTEQYTPTLRPLFEALDRLVAGKPQRVPTGSRITLANVALEAGRTPGSIKASRAVYAPLRDEILKQAGLHRENAKPGTLEVSKARIKTAQAKASSEEFEIKYKESLGRELMMLLRIEELEENLRKLGNVIPIKGR